jgi:hypothetical protein
MDGMPRSTDAIRAGRRVWEAAQVVEAVLEVDHEGGEQ